MLNENLQSEYRPEDVDNTTCTIKATFDKQPPSYNEVAGDHLPSYKSWSKKQQSV